MPTPDQISLITTIAATRIGILLAVHFVADFILQNNWMAINKSKRNGPLVAHCLVYSTCFIWAGIQFAAIMLATHFITDYITSRITSKLYQANQRHWFFVAIGADQLIHHITIITTYCLLQ